MGCSYFFNDILFMLILSYEFSVSILFVPVTMAIFSKNPSTKAAIVSMMVGIACFVGFRFWVPPIPKEILTLVLSYLGFIAMQKVDSRELQLSNLEKISEEVKEE